MAFILEELDVRYALYLVYVICYISTLQLESITIHVLVNYDIIQSTWNGKSGILRCVMLKSTWV